MSHFAHYIKRTVVDSANQNTSCELPYTEDQPKDQGFKFPTYHSVPMNSGVASRVNIGDTIWLFSQLSSPWGSLAPSLDGMIQVSEIKVSGKCHDRYRFGATKNSKWYPIFNATELILGLKAVDAQNNVRDLLNTPRTAIGQALQFLREIRDPSPLLKHAASVSELEPDFISYRMLDGTKFAFELAQRLVERNRAVFWDRWSLPRRLAERGEKVEDTALDSSIVETITNSRCVWGVTSSFYGVEGSYSKLEKELAIQLGKFRSYPPWNDG